MGNTIHIVPGTEDVANGMVVVARMLAKEQGGEVVDLKEVDRGKVAAADEVWVHGMWLPREWKVCRWALGAGKRLVRMTHGSLSPVYLEHQSKWKKRLVGPIERSLLRKSSRIIATCEAEKGWIAAYLGDDCPEIEVTDLWRFFSGRVERPARPQSFDNGNALSSDCGRAGRSPLPDKDVSSLDCGRAGRSPLPVHVLYLGRRHPLKGVEYLEKAVANLPNVELRIVSNAFGEELEKVWQWCDVLVLPTLSENFGLVVAEALERGKRVITTDGAPAWENFNHETHEIDEKGYQLPSINYQLTYLKGFRDGDEETRVRLLREAIEALC